MKKSSRFRRFTRLFAGKRFRHLVYTAVSMSVLVVAFSFVPASVMLDIKGFVMFHLGVQTDTMIYVNEKLRVMHYDTPAIKYLINNPKKCLENDPFVIIFIKTHPEHFAERQTIRNTWGNVSAWTNIPKSARPMLLFILGLAKIHPESLQAKLLKENNRHHDMIQESFIEGFHNLTVKLVSQFKWPTLHCDKAKFWMTTDDDVFVNVGNLVSFLSKVTQKSLFVGRVHAGSASNRDPGSKYYVPNSVYRGSYYPPYCPGAGYVLSMNVVEQLYRKALQTPLLYIDDAYTGIIAHAIGLSPRYDVAFLGESSASTDLCTLSKFITSHPHNGQAMYDMYRVVMNLTALDPNVVCWDRTLSWLHPNDIVYF